MDVATVDLSWFTLMVQMRWVCRYTALYARANRVFEDQVEAFGKERMAARVAELRALQSKKAAARLFHNHESHLHLVSEVSDPDERVGIYRTH